MKKLSILTVTIMIIIITIIFNYNQNKDIFIGKKEKIKEVNNSSIAIMLQNDEGEYIKSMDNEWPTGGYAFNEIYSSCENGSKLSWNIETGEVTLISNISDKCYLYFDKVDIYSVTVEVTGGHANPTSQKVIAGHDAIFTLTADEGYDLTKASVKEGKCELSNNGVTLTAKNVTGNMSCKVEIPEVRKTLTEVCKSSNELASCLAILGSQANDVGDGYLYHHDGSIMGHNYWNNESLYVKDEWIDQYPTIDSLIKQNPNNSYYYIVGENDPNHWQGNSVTGHGEKWWYSNEFALAVKAAVEKGYLGINESSIDAEDGSYRYSGNEPNNYVCLGKKADTGNGCDSNEHLYRIIGVIPVDVVTDEGQKEKQNLIKLIKSEYVTSEELGGWGSKTYGDGSSALTLNSSYSKYARIKNQSGINGFYWSGSSSNKSSEWQKSSLYSTLNNSTTGYLKKLDEISETTWSDIIETTTWNIAGLKDGEKGLLVKEVLKIEMKNSTTGTHPSTDTINAQVGLMYVSDYGFAASKDNWQANLYDGYATETNRSRNWLYNPIDEWTISRLSDASFHATEISSSGIMSSRMWVSSSAYGIRPTFYLKSTVKYLEGEGSYEKPIFLG